MPGQNRQVIELRTSGATCMISPPDGGRIAQLTVAGRDLLIARPAGDAADAMVWGSYPMAPWGGRVRDGRFAFDGHEYQLQINHPPHSIHGTVWFQPWSVSDIDDRSMMMSCALGDHWPFGGVAHQRIELSDRGLICQLGVTADDLAMPAQVGWHPWFVKPDAATFEFALMYARDTAHIPTGELVPMPSGPWDDCFIGELGPIALTFGDLTVGVSSDCSHWVIFDQLARATCVEPQSGPPDGFNAQAHRTSPANTERFTVLAPGESMQRTMSITWS